MKGARYYPGNIYTSQFSPTQAISRRCLSSTLRTLLEPELEHLPDLLLLLDQLLLEQLLLDQLLKEIV